MSGTGGRGPAGTPGAVPGRGIPRGGRAPGRLLAVLALALVGTALFAGPGAGPAAAHAALQATDPRDGATVTRPVREITLTFNEPVRGRYTTVVVTGTGDAQFADGPVRVVDAAVHQAVRPLPSGAYRVAWRAVSADGHPVEGQLGFTVALPAGQDPAAGSPSAAAGPPSAAGSADPTDPGPSSASPASAGVAGPARGTPVGQWVLLGVLALVIAALAALLVRRRANRQPSEWDDLGPFARRPRKPRRIGPPRREPRK
ncbi:copper resistance protein CopC [Plantactinospora siamensis]|uniref:Copper resistance protein CopC n=1 Tax=Plantactinospora siamensis TaxID=555372 RepID=A0ABV6P2P0_9ACTN